MTTINTAGIINSPSTISGSPLVLLANVVASNTAFVTFPSLITSSYQNYLLQFSGVYCAASSGTLSIRLSTDNGATYSTSTVYSSHCLAYSGSTFAGAPVVTASSNFQMQPGNAGFFMGTTTTNTANGEIWLYNPLGTTAYPTIRFNYNMFSSTSAQVDCWGSGFYATAGAINAFEVFIDAGNCYGNFSLYGMAV